MLLNADVRNNSAWNQRHWVVEQTGGFTSDVLKREIAYVTSHIALYVTFHAIHII
jgi:protein farnesyltransferase/geranylgeranyltransferase type-1 subunit alpha